MLAPGVGLIQAAGSGASVCDENKGHSTALRAAKIMRKQAVEPGRCHPGACTHSLIIEHCPCGSQLGYRPLVAQVLDRGERIELLVDKTDTLANESFAFRREARRLKQRLWWKNARLLALIGLIILIVAYIIVCFACSPTFHC